MPIAMPYDRARQRMFRGLMSKQEETAGGRDRLLQEKLVIKGEVVRSSIYRVSLDDLAYNKANGRIKAEVLEKEDELGRQLEPSNDEDQKIIKDILLSIRPDENDKILEDLRKNGQLRPGIITCDGIVINGNRRKAILGKLYQETGADKFKYLDAQVLPIDITKAELWLIEAGIQLSAPQQLDYSPINHLLKLRDGVSSGLKIADMAARIYGVSEESIDADITRLNLIDEYLRDFLGKPQRYYLVKQLNEHFIDLQEILKWVERPRGIRVNWQPDASDKNELKLVGFLYIRAKYPHLRIRELRDLFATKESWKEVKQALKVPVIISEKERKTQEHHTEARKDQIDNLESEEPDSTRDESTFSTTSEQGDFQEEVLWRERYKPELKAFYEDAKEQQKIIKDSERPLALAKRALKLVQGIPEDTDLLGEGDIDDVFRQIIARINELRKLIQKQRTKYSSRHK